MAESLVVRAPRGFDGERALPGGVSVLVDGGRIAGVAAADAPLPDGWPMADFPDATILPGLIDAHVHLCGDAGLGALERLPGFDDEHLAGVIDDALRRHLAAGVTTVRDLGDRRWAVLDRDAGDPLADIGALEWVEAVMVGGRWTVGGPAPELSAGEQNE